MQESVCASVFVDAHAQVSRRCVADVSDSHVAENIVLGQLSARGSPVLNLSRGCLAGQELNMSSHAGFEASPRTPLDVAVSRDSFVSLHPGQFLTIGVESAQTNESFMKSFCPNSNLTLKLRMVMPLCCCL